MTRREQWLIQRRRFRRRRERARSVNSLWGSRIVHGRTVRLAYVVVWSSSGMQPAMAEHPGPFEWNDFLEPGKPAAPFTVSPVGYRQPPHITLPAPFHRPNAFVPSSADYELIGYHRRRLQKWERKPNRLTKEQRAIWLANNQAWREGIFPDWDPLQRHPNNDDINAGAPLYSGPFPHGL